MADNCRVDGGRLQILMLTDYFPPQASGGVERAVFEVSRRLVKLGHSVTVLTLSEHASEEIVEGLRIVRVPGRDLSGLVGAQVAVSGHVWPAIRRLLRSERFDVIHGHNLFFHAALAGAVLAKPHHVPLVTTAHLGSPDDLGGVVGRLTMLYENTVGRAIVGRSDKVIAVSQAVADHVSHLTQRERITVIPNGVDLQRFQPPERPVDEPAVLFVGRLIFNKGPQFVLKAIPPVLARFPSAHFRLIGDGPMRAQLEAEARKGGFFANVEFLGQREDIPALLQQGAILVRPSLSEGLPLVALEAMACALPIVASNVGGTAEVVNDGVTGYVLETDAFDQLPDRICRLLADPALRAAMGKRGREFVERGYDWDSIAERTLGVYREVLAARTKK